MKQVHDAPLPTRTDSKGDKVNKASNIFVDLFRRIAAEKQQEKLTHG